MADKVASESFILFELAGTTYGIPSRMVQQMEMIEQITHVPNAPPFVDGIVFLRGQVVPVVSLRARFGFPKIPYDIRTRLVVLRVHDRTVGLVVDTAREFISIPQSAVEPVPEAVPDVSRRHIEGIANVNGRLVLILDADSIVAVPDDMSLPAAPNFPDEHAASLAAPTGDA